MLPTICNGSWWWIDCICIDQTNEAERNAQVRVMKTIYSYSALTIGWLSSSGEAGIEYLKVLLGEQKNLENQLSKHTCWAALERLFLDPWWTRVWTLQEYLVARKFVFHSGKASISRKDLNKATGVVHQCTRIRSEVISSAAFEHAWVRRRLLSWYEAGEDMQLLGLMAYVGDYQATDLRDRIYSLLGLATDAHIAQAAYGNTIEKVYTQLVQGFVNFHQSLDVICFADRFHHQGTELPSWCPDWRATSACWVVPAMAAQSAGSKIGNFRPLSEKRESNDTYAAGTSGDYLPLQVSFSPDRTILTCQAVFLDTIDGIGGLRILLPSPDSNVPPHAIEYSAIPSLSKPNTDPKRGPTASRDFFSALTRCLVLNRKDRYLSQKLAHGHFFKTLEDLCIAAKEAPGTVDVRFLDWFQRNQFLQIGGTCLAEILADVRPLPGGTRSVERHEDEETFMRRFDDTTRPMARRLASTNGGVGAMVGVRAKRGDEVWVLIGCSIPMVLRWAKGGKRRYKVVEECYLDGFMDGGEVQRGIAEGRLKVEQIQLG